MKHDHTVKRLIDILISLILLALLSPLLLLLVVLIRLSIGSPVLFRQQRPGLHARPFLMYKFRTMTEARNRQGQLLADDERLTRLGRFLRAASLDELPEFINVLRGEMSLVGPRPLLMEYLPLYTPEQARRHAVKPGITGWAQVNGRNAVNWEERFRLDVWYVDHQSIGLDLRILLGTLWQVLSRRGISAGGHATMPKFTGN